MFEVIGTAAGALAVISYIPYVVDMLRGRAKPERASWVIWTVLILIAFFSQLSKGATDSLWFTGLDSVGVIVILVLSIKYGVGGLARRDVLSLIFAAVGLVLWYFTSDAVYALLITIVIDASATWLTVAKTLEDPSTETYLMWVIICVASTLAMIAVGKFDLVLLAYPFYIFLANFAVVVAKFVAERRKSI